MELLKDLKIIFSYKGETNLYPNFEKLKYWMSRRLLFYELAGESLFLLRKDRDFYHLYYTSKTLLDLAKDLKQINCSVVADCIGTDMYPTIKAFEENGFKKYKAFSMMRKIVGESYPVNPDVVFPDKNEAGVIVSMFENAFDRYAEQLPSEDEMEIMIDDKEVLVVKEDKIAGVLIRTTGIKSVLKFFLIDEEYRGKGIGSKLINYCLNESDVVTLWVLSDNINAIQVYEHFGFTLHRLKNQIMIK